MTVTENDPHTWVMDALSDLFTLAAAYGKATGLAEASVSTRVLDGGGRLAQIREGRDIGVRRLRKALAWFSANWPENAVWPESIDRSTRLIDEVQIDEPRLVVSVPGSAVVEAEAAPGQSASRAASAECSTGVAA